MAWRHRIALVLLVALTGLPVSGTLCAITCESAAAQTASHHGKGRECEEPPVPSSGPQISGESAHDCSTHDASLRQVATTAERADLSAKSAPTLIDFTILGELVPLQDGQDVFDYTAPPGIAPPTERFVVLRV